MQQGGYDDLSRVVQVIGHVPETGAKVFRATGYLLADGLVLTVRHPFDEDISEGRTYEYLVRNRSHQSAVRSHVLDNSRDLALLAIDPLPVAYLPIRFGELPHQAGRVAFRAVGFPNYAVEERKTHTIQIDGFVQLGSYAGDGKLELALTSPPPRAVGKLSPWKGYSGAAVLADGVVVGVCDSHWLPSGEASLSAVPVAGIDDPGLLELFARLDYDTEPVPVHPREEEPPPALQKLITHEAKLRGLVGQRNFLTEEELPFVSPGPNHEADPRRLFARLSAPDTHRGVLLVGAAGTGKTRTCFEVAALAQKAGWRVFHTNQHKSVTVADLVQGLLGQRGGTALLVLDYLDALVELDLQEFVDTLLPEAKRRGVTIALIASVRPGPLGELYERGPEQLFDEVRLRADAAHQSAVSSHILREVAPRALERWGAEALSGVCGQRPVIALLIAREIERRLGAGENIPEFAQLRRGDLLQWLHTRLKGDGLRRPPKEKHASPMSAAPVDSWLLASAVAAAACPQPVDAVAHAVDALLGGETDFEGADVVDMLIERGWLDELGDQVRVVHDIVTDELLQHVILPAQADRVDRRSTRALLASMILDGTTFGRFAGHLRRLADELPEGRQATQLGRFFDGWIAEHAELIGGLLAAGGEDAGHTLLTLVTSPPWQPATLQAWDRIVAPWIRNEEKSPACRRFLSRALNAFDAAPAPVVEAAFGWLSAHPMQLGDDYVIRGLLLQRELPAEHAAKALDHAVRWVQQYSFRKEAQFLLNAFLRQDLRPEQSRVAIESAARWLHRHRTAWEASFVLAALLSRRDLDPDQLQKASGEAVTWLGTHIGHPEAHFVLFPLLARDDLSPQRAAQVADRSWRWLGTYPRSNCAAPLVCALLGAGSGDPERAAAAREQALAWCTTHRDVAAVSDVLRNLLNEPDLAAERVPDVVASTLAWCEVHVAHHETCFALRDLFRRPDLTPGQKHAISSVSLDWLRRCNAAPEASHLLKSLLTTPDVTAAHIAEAVGLALDWCTTHQELHDASYVLSALLRSDLDPGQLRVAVANALTWCAAYREDGEADFVLSALLDRTDLRAEEEQSAVARTTAWLGIHGAQHNAGYLLGRVLGSPYLVLAEGVTLAMDWLQLHGDTEPATRLYKPLFKREDLTPGTVDGVARHALTWLRAHGRTLEASHSLQALLERPDVSPSVAATAVDLALPWAGTHHTNEAAWHVLNALLKHEGLPADKAAGVARHALTWLRAHGTTPQASHLLQALLQRPDVSPMVTATAVDLALSWAGTHHTNEAAWHVLNALLKREGLPADKVATTARSALNWLDTYGTTPQASHLLQALLQRPDVPPPVAAKAVELALPWAETHHTNEAAWHVLNALLKREDLSADAFAAAARPALGWLDAHGTTPQASHLLHTLHRRPGLAPALSTAAADQALRWLDAGQGQEAQYLLKTLLAARALLPRQSARAVDHGCAWLTTYGEGRDASHVLAQLLRRQDLTPGSADTAAGLAMRWLAAHGHTEQAQFALSSLLPRPDLTPDLVRRAVRHTVSWLDLHGTEPSAAYVLRALLEQPRLTTETVTPATDRALTWLATHGTSRNASFLLRALLTRTDLPAATVDRAARRALGWLGRCGTEPSAAHVLRALLEQPRLTTETVTPATDRALTWLATHGTSRNASYVLRALLTRTDLPAATVDRTVRHAFGWLDRNGTERNSGFVLQPLVERTAPEESPGTSPVDYALGWLRSTPSTHDKWPEIRAALGLRTDLSDRQRSALEDVGAGGLGADGVRAGGLGADDVGAAS
ncbi:hypothetical protein ACH4SK_37550 [Streptomyces inhibens]|uniref:hypothetical protein n=1 Tax=Streptomyces inhibens TaxID=2293571 RepID=UPI0037905871